MTYRTFVAGAPSAATAYALHLLERTVDEAEQRMAAYYARAGTADAAAAAGLGSVPVVREDLDPVSARVLAIAPGEALSQERLANILGGRSAEGEELEGHQRGLRRYEAEEGGAERHRIAGVDLCFSAPKSVSVAWAFADTDAERNSILQAHRDARDEALAYIEQEIGVARDGERGRLAWITVDHFTARPTVEVTRPDPTTGVVATELYTLPRAGDPQLHSHCVVPNLLVTASGRVLSINRDLMRDRVHEFGAVYQAMLARRLRTIGVEVELDARTLAARLPCIPEAVCDEFSRRTRDAQSAAREHAVRAGRDWDAMPEEARIAFLKAGAKASRQGKGDDLADADAWRAQAAAIGWSHRSAVRAGRPSSPAREADRIAAARAVAAELLGRELERRAVQTAGDVRAAAARGLISTGAASADDVLAVTRALARDGVVQDGRRTALIWRGGGPEDGRARVTTALHRDQEEELVRLARAAGADRRGALRPSELEAATRRTGVALSPEQEAAARALGEGGRLAVAVGAAGVGKTTLLRVLVDAWTAGGREAWGAALAWRQAGALEEAGIPRDRLRALQPLLDGLADGSVNPGRNAVVVVDELGQIGTRQLLELLRFQARHGFKVVAVGDERQCQAQPLGSKVLTPDGWRRIGDLQVGEAITCPDGSVSRVEAVADQGVKEIYRVRFVDRRAVECCGDHLWAVWRAQPIYSEGSHATRRVINKGGEWAVLPLVEIKQWFDSGLVRARAAAVPLAAPSALELPEQALPIPPYALGLLLGGGHFVDGVVRFSTSDAVLLDSLIDLLPEFEAASSGQYERRLKVRDRASHTSSRRRYSATETLKDAARQGGRREPLLSHNGRTQTLSAGAAGSGLSRDKVWQRLARLGWPVAQALGLEPRARVIANEYSPLSRAVQALGLRGTRSDSKFVPRIYKTGSVAQRLAVLQGLLDTDGTVGDGGTYAVYVTTSTRLAEDVQELAWSLGATTSLGSRVETVNDKATRRQYRVGIRYPDTGQLFRLPRKVAQARPTARKGQLRIASVEAIGSKRARCIAIGHPDGLYVTDGFVVTHNSVEAGPVIGLLREALGPKAVPEVLTTVRQRGEREREIAGLFRGTGTESAEAHAANVARALAMKREDGTAELVPGGYREAVERTATLVLARRDAGGPGYTVTVSAPTNADALAIGRAIRARRQARGEVGPDRLAVRATDGAGNAYTLALAVGDRVRLFGRTRGVFAGPGGRGKSAAIGDNGSVLEVAEVRPSRGLVLRTAAGKQGFVAWEKLRDAGSGRVRLAYGDCLTIDSSQGLTSDEHVNALPGGSRAVTGFKAYVAESRHRVASWLVGSAGAELRHAADRRPINAPPSADAAAEAWENVARNLARQPVRETALGLLRSAVAEAKEGARAFQATLRATEAREAAGVPATTLRRTLERTQANRALPRLAAALDGAARSLADIAARVEAVAPPSLRTITPSPARQPAVRRVRISEMEAQTQLRAAMWNVGLRPPGLPVMDGQRHYVPVEGNRGRRMSGAYLAFYDEGVPNALMWNYKTGTKAKWVAAGDAVRLRPDEAARLAAAAEARRADQAAERARREEAGAAMAAWLLEGCRPADAAHPYLARKAVAPHGLAQDLRGRLAVPLQDAKGRLWNLQTIGPGGEKLFLPGARKAGTFFTVGSDHEPHGPLWIAEGFATAATVHAATGQPAVVALDASNLAAVAASIRARDPARPLLFAADNDHHLPRRPEPLPNVGLDRARAAAAAVGGRVAAPEFAPSDRGTDWNDFAARHGLAAARDALRAALRRPETDGPAEAPRLSEAPSVPARVRERAETGAHGASGPVGTRARQGPRMGA